MCALTLVLGPVHALVEDRVAVLDHRTLALDAPVLPRATRLPIPDVVVEAGVEEPNLPPEVPTHAHTHMQTYAHTCNATTCDVM